MIRAKAATPVVFSHWFDERLKPTLDKLNIGEKPHGVFNVDESGFPLSGRPAHIICKTCPEMGCQLIKLIDLFDPHGMKNLYGEV